MVVVVVVMMMVVVVMMMMMVVVVMKMMVLVVMILKELKVGFIYGNKHWRLNDGDDGGDADANGYNYIASLSRIK